MKETINTSLFIWFSPNTSARSGLALTLPPSSCVGEQLKRGVMARFGRNTESSTLAGSQWQLMVAAQVNF